MHEETFHVVLCIDKNYEPYALTLINQIKNMRRNWNVEIHILVIEGFNTNNIREFCSKNLIKSHTYEVNLEKISREFKSVGHLSQTSYLKLFIPEYLPKDIQHCTYLDVDILILSDFHELIKKTSPFPVSAVRNFGEEWTHHDAFKNIDEKFNSGILSINLKRWRELDLTTKMVSTHLRYGALPYLDNDVLVLCLHDFTIEWGDLDSKFNVLDSKVSRKSQLSPSIIHFAGQAKPWNSPFGGRFSRLYRIELLKVVPEFGFSPGQYKKYFQNKLTNFLYRIILPFLRVRRLILLLPDSKSSLFIGREHPK
jgi:lipopolysaccharide biosynthesis glycosyltransferase